MAPHSKLILYPQYPEVRLSGFLRGCGAAPNELMSARLRGRVLFLGVKGRMEILAFAASARMACTREVQAVLEEPTDGVLVEIPIAARGAPEEVPVRLLKELRRIYLAKWVDARQLAADGTTRPCSAPNGGGYTLEAELGIAKNGEAAPDFDGWEIKQHAVASLDSPIDGKAITLLTPEPTGGYYTQYGVPAFVRKFGYPDRRGRHGRWNFGGVYRHGETASLTGLKLRLRGFDATRCEITDAHGAIEIADLRGCIAMEWSFAKMLEHWSKKHEYAAYVPSLKRDDPRRQYRYGRYVRLAKHTSGLLLLRAIAAGSVYYDPGIKVEVAGKSQTVKRRSQFRVCSRELCHLYREFDSIDVLRTDC